MFKKYKDIKIDPLVAKVLDGAAKLPLIKLEFSAHVRESTKNDIREIFEKIRPNIEYELIQQGLL